MEEEPGLAQPLPLWHIGSLTTTLRPSLPSAACRNLHLHSWHLPKYSLLIIAYKGDARNINRPATCFLAGGPMVHLSASCLGPQ